MNKTLCAILIALSPSMGSAAFAEALCQGKVNQINIHPEGTVYVDFGYGFITLCETNGALNIYRGANQGGNASLTTAMCQNLLSSFMTAQATGKQVAAHVDASTCAFTAYAIPNPYPYSFVFLP